MALEVAEKAPVRDVSPTRALWESRRAMQGKVDHMAFLGLHVFDPAWNEAGFQMKDGDVSKAKTARSTTFKECTLTIYGTDKTMSCPVQTCTTAGDVKEMLALQAMVDPGRITMIIKQGCSWAVLRDEAEVARRVIVKGITSFEPQPHKYPHPTGIIGAGYNGIKHALYWLHHGDSNFVMFDRYDRVGGHAWLIQANKTSKLQTEFASFHVWFGMEWGEDNEKLSFPREWETWPRKAKILEHMQHAAERYGILPHIRFQSNIVSIDNEGNHRDPLELDRSFFLNVKSTVPGDDREEHVQVSNIYHFPGAYFNARVINYPGEEDFGGQIGYGMKDDIPFDYLEGSRTAILGNGAYGVENIRTCCEYGVDKVYLITRRKNLALPRLCCWFCHQGLVPTPASMLLRLMEPMYEISGFGDIWQFHSVYGSRDKGRVEIKSHSRFGIGDVTFLACATGRCEYRTTKLKRVTPNTLHLETGEKLENMNNLIKCLGLIADWECDRLHKIKELIGSWPNGDHRRVIYADPIGMHAANFTSHSTGGGSYSTSISWKYFLDYPKEIERVHTSGAVETLPRNKADPDEDRPAHQFDAKYMMLVSFTVDGMCPKMQIRMMGMDDYMHKLFWAVNPLDKYYQECVDSWNEYQEQWKKQGAKFEYVPYPYSKEDIQAWFKEFEDNVGPISLEGRAEWKPKGAPEDVEPAAVQFDRGGSQSWWQERGVVSVSA